VDAAAAKVKAEKEAAAKRAKEEQEAKEKAKQDADLSLVIPEKLDENLASNNWVIHGNYTKTGKPLLAGDPHLGN
jgi:penicillin amidase